MRYSFSLSLRRVKRNLKIFSVVIIQMCIGFTVLFTALNVRFSMRDRLELLRGDISGAEIENAESFQEQLQIFYLQGSY